MHTEQRPEKKNLGRKKKDKEEKKIGAGKKISGIEKKRDPEGNNNETLSENNEKK